MFRSIRVVSLLLCALPLIPLAIGCGGGEPVSAAKSGLRPTDEDLKQPDDQVGPQDGKRETDAANGRNDETPPPREDPRDEPPGDADPSTVVDDDAILNVPDGTATELAEYLDSINAELATMLQRAQAAPPTAETRDAFVNRFSDLLDAQLTASKKILADEEATETERRMAAQAVFDSLEPLAQIGKPEAAENARTFAASLADDDDPQIRRQAVAMRMDDEIAKIRAGEVKDAAQLLEHMKVVFSGTPDDTSMMRFMSTQSAAQEMLKLEKPPAAVEIMNVMGRHFVDAEHPQLAQAGQDLLDQAKIIQLDSSLRRLIAEQDGAEGDLLGVAEKLLTDEAVDARTMQVVVMMSATLKDDHPETRSKLLELVNNAIKSKTAAADLPPADLIALANVAQDLGEDYGDTAEATAGVLSKAIDQQLADATDVAAAIDELHSSVAVQAEYSGNIELAKKTYSALSAATEKVADADAKESLEQQLAAAQKRVGLVGKPLTVEGALLDGKPFDWAKYEGKVVLIDFWATWCRPCLAEIPNILDNYEKYHDQGFDVVGINIDDDPATVVDFFAARGDLPWATVVSNDPDAAGPASAMAEKCGVISIPFVVLVGRDGNVEAIHVRGPALGEKLAELFPDGPKTEEAAPVDELPEEDAPTDDAPESDEPETEPATP